MKKLLIALLACSGFLVFSCSKDNGTSSKTCDVSTDPYSATDNASVSYSVTITGTASVSSITYQGASGSITKSNPTLPFSAAESIDNGKPISIEANGTTTGGTITVSYNAIYPDGNASNSQTCGN